MSRFRKAGVALKQCVGLETVRTLLKGEVLHLASGGTIILAPSLPCQRTPSHAKSLAMARMVQAIVQGLSAQLSRALEAQARGCGAEGNKLAQAA